MNNSDFVWDKVAGLVAIVINICCVAFVAGLASIFAAVGLTAGAVPGLAAGAIVGVVLMLVIGSSVLGVVAGFGMLQGKRWGFLLGAIVFGLATLSNLSGGNGLGVGLEAALMIYSILRLTGNVGPRLEN